MDQVRLGVVIGTHGIKGEIKIRPSTQFPEERFAPGRTIYLIKDGKAESYEVASFRMHKHNALVKMTGFDNINDVERFRGYEVYAERDDIEEEGFYYDELIGCTIMDDVRGALGEIIDIQEMPTQDLLVVRHHDRVYRIPYVDAFILDEDIDGRVVYVHLIEGLYDEN